MIAYHETVSIFDQNVTSAAITFEKTLQIAFSNAVRQTTNIYSWTNHIFIEPLFEQGHKRIFEEENKLIKLSKIPKKKRKIDFNGRKIEEIQRNKENLDK